MRAAQHIHRHGRGLPKALPPFSPPALSAGDPLTLTQELQDRMTRHASFEREEAGMAACISMPSPRRISARISWGSATCGRICLSAFPVFASGIFPSIPRLKPFMPRLTPICHSRLTGALSCGDGDFLLRPRFPCAVRKAAVPHCQRGARHGRRRGPGGPLFERELSA